MDYGSILYGLMANRRSIRRFKQDAVPEPLILKMLEAARLAPSASNRQPSRFYIVSDQFIKEKLSRSGAIKQKFVLEAPLCIVCCADMRTYSTKETESAVKELAQAEGMVLDPENVAGYWAWWNRVSEGNGILNLAYLDLGIAVEHMVLMGTALGLGTCWMRRIDEEGIAKALDLSADMLVVALLAVGYPAENPQQRPRKELTNFILSKNVI